MSKAFWAQACNAAISRPLRDATNAWGAVVSAAFVVSAIAGGVMFVRWWRLDAENRLHIWRHYGWFTGLICAGSCTGAVSSIAWSQWLANYHETDYDPDNLRDSMQLIAATSAYSRVRWVFFLPVFLHFKFTCTLRIIYIVYMLSILKVALQALRWLVVYAIAYPFTLGCLVITKLLVLDRLMDFSKLKGDGASSWLVKVAKMLVGIVVIGNIAGLAGNIAAAVFFSRAAQSYEVISISPDSKTELEYRTNAQSYIIVGSRAASVHIGFETGMLLLIVICISVVGIACARRIRAALQSMQHSKQISMTNTIGKNNSAVQHFAALSDHAISSGRLLRRQIIFSCSAVFASFLLRSAFTSMFTFVSATANINEPCKPYNNRCNPDCYSIVSHILVWILFTPELHFAVVFFSQPVTLLVALWSMTSGQTLEVLNATKSSSRL